TPPAAPPTASVPNPPPSLLDLPIGARLEAVIASNLLQGQVEIDTAIGKLILHTGFPLPKGGPLQLQLLAKGAVPQLLITAVHGLNPQAALRLLGLGAAAREAGGLLNRTGAAAQGGLAGGQAQAAAQGSAGAGPTPVNLTVGATLVATLLRAGPPPLAAGFPGAPAAQPGQATPGQGVLPGRQGIPGTPGQGIPGAARPGGHGPLAQPPSAGQPPGIRPGAAGHAAPPAGALQPGQASSGGPASLPPGTLFSVRIVAFQPAGGEASPLRPGGGLSLAPGNTLTGVVTGQAQHSGQPIVQTLAGALIVATRTPLPVGGAVTFEVLSQSAAAEAQHPSAHAGRPAGWLGDSWPRLAEAMAALEEINPAAAQQLAQAVLPRPGAALGANLLFFLVALYGSDLRGWMGDGPSRLLQRFRPDLLARLRDDFGQMSRAVDERGPGDWRTTPIPFYNGNEIEQIRLHMRRAGDDEEDEEKGRKGNRFVIDINLSRFGRFQLDGLVYRKEK
ncbi:MAG TPA: hypothetical protein VGA19_02570, partial [Rhodospirillales bacterium]